MSLTLFIENLKKSPLAAAFFTWVVMFIMGVISAPELYIAIAIVCLLPAQAIGYVIALHNQK